MSEPQIVFDPLPGEALTRLVIDAVDLHNVAATGIAEWHPANFFLRGEIGEWQGGLLGQVWGGWLHVKFLWVAAPLRGRGHGTRLLRAAERHAAEKGCLAATLETFSFQARPFYERHGYQVFGTIERYPPGHAKFFLKKQLVPRDAGG